MICDAIAHAVVAIPTMARRMARKRSIAFQRKVASSAYIAERDGRAILKVLKRKNVRLTRILVGVAGKARGNE